MTRRKIDFIELDWKENFTDEDYDKLKESVPDGIFFHPQIDRHVDSKMLVRGPEEMSEWIEKNAISLFDAGDYTSDLAWDGEKVVGFHRKKWRSLGDILYIESEEDPF